MHFFQPRKSRSQLAKYLLYRVNQPVRTCQNSSNHPKKFAGVGSHDIPRDDEKDQWPSILQAVEALKTPPKLGYSEIECKDPKAKGSYRTAYFIYDGDKNRAYCRFSKCNTSYSIGTNRIKWEDHLLSSHGLSSSKHKQVIEELKRSTSQDILPPALDLQSQGSHQRRQLAITNFTEELPTESHLEAMFNLRLLQYAAAHSVPMAAITSDSSSFKRLVNSMEALVRHRVERGTLIEARACYCLIHVDSSEIF